MFDEWRRSVARLEAKALELDAKAAELKEKAAELEADAKGKEQQLVQILEKNAQMIEEFESGLDADISSIENPEARELVRNLLSNSFREHKKPPPPTPAP